MKRQDRDFELVVDELLDPIGRARQRLVAYLTSDSRRRALAIQLGPVMQGVRATLLGPGSRDQWRGQAHPMATVFRGWSVGSSYSLSLSLSPGSIPGEGMGTAVPSQRHSQTEKSSTRETQPVSLKTAKNEETVMTSHQEKVHPNNLAPSWRHSRHYVANKVYDSSILYMSSSRGAMPKSGAGSAQPCFAVRQRILGWYTSMHTTCWPGG